jgi:hypothetical protein
MTDVAGNINTLGDNVRKILNQISLWNFVPLSLKFSIRSLFNCALSGFSKEEASGGGASSMITEPDKQQCREAFGLRA